MEDGANCVNTVTADPMNGGGGGGPIVSNGPTQAEGVDLLTNTLPASDNSQAKEMQPKYTKAIRAPILTAPVAVRQCMTPTKKIAAAVETDMNSSRKSKRLANKQSGDMTMEEQATALHMKKCNFLDKKKKPDVKQDPILQLVCISVATGRCDSVSHNVQPGGV